jgi:putative endonuclease
VSLLARLGRRPRPGAAGESLACRHLEARGYAILERNFRCRSGELDLVARRAETTVFVEVKERGAGGHGAGHEAVTFAKRRRILRAAKIYACCRGLDEQPLRFDVICVDWVAGQPRIQHYEDAFGEVD